jgi:NADH-quinone oxidoreductase subunit J
MILEGLKLAGISPITLAACIFFALGLWLLLPRGTNAGKAFGLVCTTASLGLFASRLHLLDDWVSDGLFYSMAAVTLVSAVGAISMRSPVYCAIWFALTLLGTAGLFFFQGAQFLGVATVVVYAGAILVTVLFMLMLCNPEGHSLYDRLSWEAGISAGTGALLVFLLTWTATATFDEPMSGPAPIAAPATAEAQAQNILSPRHVERLGAELFSKHLIAVETAGTLLLVALVGAVAIIAHGKQADAKVAASSTVASGNFLPTASSTTRDR